MSDTISNEGMKILIDKMNRCAELSAKRGQMSVTFDLPKIVVIGSQSSGKSSVLEVSLLLYLTIQSLSGI